MKKRGAWEQTQCEANALCIAILGNELLNVFVHDYGLFHAHPYPAQGSRDPGPVLRRSKEKARWAGLCDELLV